MSTPQNQVFLGTTQTNVITVNSPGPQGPTGPLGNPGPTGPANGPTGPTGPPNIPGPPEFTDQLSAVVPSGASDSFSPFGYIPGTTNALLLTPTDNTSTLLGLASTGAPDGFSIIIVNPSATFTLTLLSESSSTPANQFVNGGNASLVIPVLGAALFVYLTGIGWQVIGSAGGGGGGSGGVNYSTVISAVLAGGSTDWGASPPSGFVSNLTNQIQITPSDNSVLDGLLAPSIPGFSVLIVNLSGTFFIEFAHQSASDPGNQFNCPSGMPVAIAAFGSTTVSWVSGQGWFFT